MKKEMMIEMIKEALKVGKALGETESPQYKELLRLKEALESGDAEIKAVSLGVNKSDPDDDEDYSTWKQVGKLTGEEIIMRRNLERELLDATNELKALSAKADVLEASIKAGKASMWAKINKNHSLPQGDFHLTDDGRILANPKTLRGPQGETQGA